MSNEILINLDRINNMKTILLLQIVIFFSACSKPTDTLDPQPENSYTLLKTIDISEMLSPNGNGVGRPDIIAIGDELYLAVFLPKEIIILLS